MNHNRTLATGLAAAALLTVTPSAQTPSTRMFVGARVYDGTDRPPVDNAVIMVRDGKITQIATATPELVRAAGSVSLAGKTIIPGLVNAHGHVGGTVGLQGNRYSAENVMRDLHLYADYGITTVVSLGDDQAPSFAARDAQRTATLDRTRLFAAGPR